MRDLSSKLFQGWTHLKTFCTPAPRVPSSETNTNLEIASSYRCWKISKSLKPERRVEIVNEIVRLSNRGQARGCRTNTSQRSNMWRGRTTSDSEERKSRWLLSRCDNTLSYACQCDKLGTEHGVNIWHTLTLEFLYRSLSWLNQGRQGYKVLCRWNPMLKDEVFVKYSSNNFAIQRVS